MRTASKATAASLVLLIAALVCGYVVGRRVPDLQGLISIEDEMWVADGGSVHVVLRDATNRRYAIGVEGSLRVPPSSFEVYVQPWFPFFPVPIYVTGNSQEEQALLAAVETWRNQLADPKSEGQSLAQVARVLRSRKS
jgi:hypothetical protein